MKNSILFFLFSLAALLFSFQLQAISPYDIQSPIEAIEDKGGTIMVVVDKKGGTHHVLVDKNGQTLAQLAIPSKYLVGNWQANMGLSLSHLKSGQLIYTAQMKGGQLALPDLPAEVYLLSVEVNGYSGQCHVLF